MIRQLSVRTHNLLRGKGIVSIYRQEGDDGNDSPTLRRYVMEYSLAGTGSRGVSSSPPLFELYVYQVYHACYIISYDASGILPWKGSGASTDKL